MICMSNIKSQNLRDRPLISKYTAMSLKCGYIFMWTEIKTEYVYTTDYVLQIPTARQSLAYSVKHTQLLITTVHNSPAPSERSCTNRDEIIDAGRTTSFVLNSTVAEPNLTEFWRDVEK